ncbi:MAG: formyltransferase [Betaproteobacteria bacterium]|nr:formyltransferase [Betaproteobacteria bacterium]
MAAPTAVVFAYHNVGVRCLTALLEGGVEVKRVVTHQDNPKETIWFESVAALAQRHGIDTVTPADPNAAEFIAELRALAPDFLFSFYYRQMLAPELLAVAPRGAFNMHGSLLPKYRGRVPVNWAIIHGETETGATLHEMVAKPDAGDIVDQARVGIGPDETAKEVFDKVTAAAETVMRRTLPGLIAGTAPRTQQDLALGSYFGGRKPEDGVIDWNAPAQSIHNLVRAVAPPYPGATTAINGEAVTVTETRLAPAQFRHNMTPQLNVANDMVIALCGDGHMLRLTGAIIDGMPHNEIMLAVRLGNGRYPL